MLLTNSILFLLSLVFIFGTVSAQRYYDEDMYGVAAGKDIPDEPTKEVPDEKPVPQEKPVPEEPITYKQPYKKPVYAAPIYYPRRFYYPRRRFVGIRTHRVIEGPSAGSHGILQVMYDNT